MEWKFGIYWDVLERGDIARQCPDRSKGPPRYRLRRNRGADTPTLWCRAERCLGHIGSMNLYGAESHAPFGDSTSHYLVTILSAADAEGLGILLHHGTTLEAHDISGAS